MPEAREEVYKSVDGTDLRLYIFEPEDHTSSDRAPAIVFFFGGAWRAGSPSQFREHSKYLASRGMVAIVADYRVESRNGTKVHESVADAEASMRWVRSHADVLGIDRHRIAAGGGSAGGQLAAAVATLPGLNSVDADRSISVNPNALALFNPVTVMAKIDGRTDLDEAAVRFHSRVRTPPQSVSPYHHIGADPPPTIIFHGMADTVAPYETAEMFCEKWKSNGGRCELEGYPGKTHGFSITAATTMWPISTPCARWMRFSPRLAGSWESPRSSLS